jgi:hypothetical protein
MHLARGLQGQVFRVVMDHAVDRNGGALELAVEIRIAGVEGLDQVDDARGLDLDALVTPDQGSLRTREDDDRHAPSAPRAPAAPSRRQALNGEGAREHAGTSAQSCPCSSASSTRGGDIGR